MDAAREVGVRSDAAHGGRRLKRVLELAARRRAATVVIVGDDEWAAGEASVRDMASGQQRRVSLDDLVAELAT
jgi:histidyl-tRNA synthetase